VNARGRQTAQRREARAREVRRRRGAALLVLAVCTALVIVLATGSGSGRHPARHVRAHAQSSGLVVSVASAGTLPSPLQDAAGAADPAGTGAVLLGGLNAEETSTATIQRVASGAVTSAGTLPTALHDACAAELGGTVYLFGGGQQESVSGILAVRASTPGGTLSAEQVATLPTPASDVACAVLGGAIYVVGGYTGAEALQTILVWRPGTVARVAGTLPKALRYAAVAAVGQSILIAGGTSGTEASRDVYSFDTRTGALQRLAQLPFAVTHAAGAALDGRLLVIGGREAAHATQHSSILAVSPSGTVTVAGRLPLPLSDTAAVATGATITVAGGLGREGNRQTEVLNLSASR
jgi:N-acetylneuraminic acid mutarotase